MTVISCDTFDTQGWCSHPEHMGTTPERWALASRDAGLGVGHIWTEVRCPAYRSLDPADCSCNKADRGSAGLLLVSLLAVLAVLVPVVIGAARLAGAVAGVQ